MNARLPLALAALTLCCVSPVAADSPAATPLPNPNGFDYLVQAANATVEAAPMQGVTNTAPNLGDPATLAAANDLIRRNEPAVNLLHQSFQYDFRVPPITPATLMPYLSKERSLARVLAFESNVYAAEGKTDQAVQASLDAIEEGAEMSKGGGLIHMLVGVACESIGRRSLWAVGKLDGDQCKAAVQRLQAIDAKRTPLADIILTEKAMGDTVIHQGSRGSNWKADLAKDEEDPATRAAILQAPDDVTSLAPQYDAYMDAQAASSRLPFNANKPAVPPINDFLQTILIPSFTPVFFKDGLNRTQDSLTCTALALYAYDLDHHGYPDSLEKLVPAYLPSVPLDPLSAGSKLQYRLYGSQPVLYSVGPDGKDDGGKPISGTIQATSTGDIVAGVNIP